MANFDPTGFDLDIYTQDVVGLGKGKGFATKDRGSVLGRNELCETISCRMLDLLELFVEHGITTPKEIAERFELATTVQLEGERDETQALKEERESGYAKIREIIQSIEETIEAFGTYFFDDKDGLEAALSTLSDAVQALLDAYSAGKEAAEGVMASIQEMIDEIESRLGSEGEFIVDEDAGLGSANEQLKNAVERLLDELSAGGENDESDS